MDEDQEIRAMVQIKEALFGLDDDTVKRVIQWAASRYGVTTLSSTSKKATGSTGNKERATGEDTEFEDVASLFDAANPSTEPEKVLVVAYWLQILQGQSDVEAQSINNELKQLGHGITNITRALDNLVNRKPRLVIQTRKSGTTQQARKKFKITTEGSRKVKTMLAGTVDEEQ